MQASKVLSQKTVFQSKYFRVDQAVIERNGKTITKDLIIRNETAIILPITPENEIYLVSQYRDALKNVALEVVAGTIEAGDDPLESAKRELAEETGLAAKAWKKIATINLSANLVSTAHVFLAQDLTQNEAHPDDDEEIEVLKIPFEEAVKKVMTGEIAIASNMAAILMLDKLQKKGKIENFNIYE